LKILNSDFFLILEFLKFRNFENSKISNFSGFPFEATANPVHVQNTPYQNSPWAGRPGQAVSRTTHREPSHAHRSLWLVQTKVSPAHGQHCDWSQQPIASPAHGHTSKWSAQPNAGPDDVQNLKFRKFRNFYDFENSKIEISKTLEN
jgi:hypothetical protein